MSDVEPTINGVGGEGFAVDGTDSFAIAPVALSDEPAGPPPGSRRGLYMTLVAGLALVLVVVIAGSAGGGDQSSLRGGDVSTTEPARSTTTTEATERTDPDDDDESSDRLSGDEFREPFEVGVADEVTETTSFDSEFDDDFDDFDDFDDDFDDFDDFDDDDFSSSGGGSYLPRRVPYVPSSRRPTITVPPWYRLPTIPEDPEPEDPEPEDPEDTTTTTTTATTTTVADTTAPAAPVIAGPVGLTNDNTPQFTGSGENASTVTVSEGVSALCTAVVASGGWSCAPATPLADGLHSIGAAAVDAAGNRATGPTVNLTIDTQAPAAPVIVSPADRSGTPDSTPTLIGTGEDGSTVTVSEGTSVLCTAPVTAGAWSCTATTTLSASEHTLTPTAVDVAGNSTAGAAVRVTVAPTAPVITAPADGSGTPDTTPTFTGTGADDSTVTVSEGTSTLCTAVVSQRTWSCDAPELAVGTYLVTTLAGTVPGTSIRLTIASAAPVVSQPANGSTVNATTVTFSGTGRTGDTVMVSEGATTTCTDVVEGGAWTCTSGTLADGPHTFTTSARNAASASTPGASVMVTIDAP